MLQVAAEVSAPLAKTDTIVMLGDDRTTSEVSRLLSNLPPAVQALTGTDLSGVSVPAVPQKFHCLLHSKYNMGLLRQDFRNHILAV